jgi:DNA polymerase I - 3''-5'' exonuclease and polymerase domains
MSLLYEQFREICLVDFEFSQPHGDRPTVRCMVVKELRSGRTIRLWADQLSRLAVPPFGIGTETLFVAYFASAEMNCFLSLGWPFPCYVLDLFVEFRNMTNGQKRKQGNGLLDTLFYFGLDGLEAVEKDEMRQLAIQGGPYTREEKNALLDYCESDVRSLEKLLDRMISHIDLPRALLRGCYMKAVAMMESTGIPIDVPLLDKVQMQWDSIKERLIRTIDASRGIYDGTRFVAKRFEEFLREHRIPWPRLHSGKLALDDDTFRSQAKIHPIISPLRELKRSLDTLRLSDFSIGKDGRNRCLLSPFRSITGRNQASSTQFIFGPSVWLRGLIKPQPGWSLAYIDWSQQEFGIAAALSRDSAMIEAYRSGDPYLAFAKQAGAIPKYATKQSHSVQRELYKQAILAVQYGMGAKSLAERLGQPLHVGEELLRHHRRIYPKFWKWAEATKSYSLLHFPLQTVFGWTLHPHENPNLRSLANFPVQGNGAEMLRIACILGVERGIGICAPIHDAVLIEAPTGQINAVATEMQAMMREASRIVLDCLELRSDVKFVHAPDRYMDERGIEMWNKVMPLIGEPDKMVKAR